MSFPKYFKIGPKEQSNLCQNYAVDTDSQRTSKDLPRIADIGRQVRLILPLESLRAL